MAEDNQNQQVQDHQMSLQRVYIKDISFEAPNTPDVFMQDWKPAVEGPDVKLASRKLDNDMYEVSLKISMTAKSNDMVAFVIEVDQAGAFLLKGYDEPTLHRLLNAYCPSVIYPYARETIDNLCVKGSFPPVMLQPFNFEGMYLAAAKQAAAKKADAKKVDVAAVE
jgi:preprotein translocase subunit SecB